MATKSVLDCERERLEKMKTYQLPNQFKKVGVGLAILSFILLLVNKLSIDQEWARIACRYGLLIGLLVVSISKEEIEDELVSKLRMQSYTFAFTFGVIYALILPFLDFFIDLGLKPEEAMFKDMGDFQILWILLSIQVFCFWLLKRMYR